MRTRGWWKARGSRKGGLRDGLAPVADGLELAQDIYLSRPRPPVTYGDPDPDPDLTLVDDRPEPDPGDLRAAHTPAS